LSRDPCAAEPWPPDLSFLRSGSFGIHIEDLFAGTPAQLAVRNLVVGRGGKAILPPLDFSVGRGSLIWLAGPNGSGKTVFFETLLGLLEPLRGEAADRLARAWLEAHGIEEAVQCSALSEDVSRRKLASVLAALARQRDICLLDEPSLFLSSRMTLA
jgi:ABC-type cobalamin/Fe3+-siderophores transport system ATPase subunit